MFELGRSLGEGDPNGKFSEERCTCVRARGLCGERWLMLPGQNRGSECTPAPPPARISAVFVSVVVSVLSRFCLGCLGFVSVLSRFCLGVVSCGNTLWKDMVETHCADTLWKHMVKPHG